MLESLQSQLAGVHLGGAAAEQTLRPILSNPVLFGVDLYAVGLAEKVAGMLREMLAGPGAVRRTLEKYV